MRIQAARLTHGTTQTYGHGTGVYIASTAKPVQEHA